SFSKSVHLFTFLKDLGWAAATLGCTSFRLGAPPKTGAISAAVIRPCATSAVAASDVSVNSTTSDRFAHWSSAVRTQGVSSKNFSSGSIKRGRKRLSCSYPGGLVNSKMLRYWYFQVLCC